MAPMAASTTTPHEPEIEFLGKLVRKALLGFRGAAGLAGVAALVYAAANFVDPPAVEVSTVPDMTPGPVTIHPIAPYFVWLCIGIPPLVPVRWLFGRGRWPMLLVGLVLWIGPSWLQGDSDYGYIIRFFASLVAVSVLLVWKTVFALTERAANAPEPPRS